MVAVDRFEELKPSAASACARPAARPSIPVPLRICACTSEVITEEPESLSLCADPESVPFAEE